MRLRRKSLGLCAGAVFLAGQVLANEPSQTITCRYYDRGTKGQGQLIRKILNTVPDINTLLECKAPQSFSEIFIVGPIHSSAEFNYYSTYYLPIENDNATPQQIMTGYKSADLEIEDTNFFCVRPDDCQVYGGAGYVIAGGVTPESFARFYRGWQNLDGESIKKLMQESDDLDRLFDNGGAGVRLRLTEIVRLLESTATFFFTVQEHGEWSAHGTLTGPKLSISDLVKTN